MRFVALDLELNQPSNRIIQIGAAAFDTDHGVLDPYTGFIDPGEEIGWNYVLDTGQTLEQLLAPGFKRVWSSEAVEARVGLRSFWEWFKGVGCGKKIIQWGRGDTDILVKESQGCGYPSHLRVLDLKQVYRFLWQPAARLEAKSQLGIACENMNVTPPSPAHDALEDALATGRLALKMFKQVEGLHKLLEVAGG